MMEPPSTADPDDELPLLHPTYARLLGMLLRGLNADVDAVLSAAGLSAARLATEAEWLGLRTVRHLVAAAGQASAQPALGLLLGRSVALSAHGAVGYAVVASRDLRQALEVVVRFGSLRNAAIDFELSEHHDGLALCLHERVALGEVRCFVLEAMLATVLRIIESVLGYAPERLRIELPWAAPAWHDAYRALSRGQLQFDAPAMRFVFDAETLAEPCITADRAAFEAAWNDCEQQLQSRCDGALAPRLRRLLHEARQTGRGYPDLDTAARQCGVSRRTLMRKLKREGSSFQALLDEERRGQALWFLQHTREPVERIAERLGYADTSNFSRTFRRWFGCAPSSSR